MKNKDLKKIYTGIFKEGYEKTYTSVYTNSVMKGLELTEEIKEILASEKWKGKKVVDVGCGTGMFAYAAALKGAEVLGIDYIPEAIEAAEQNYSHPKLEYRVGDAKTLKGTYDIIVSIGTLEHMDNPLVILKKFKKHLNPGGKIIITSPNWTNPRGYMLLTLKYLFDAPITLADLHYLTPFEFEGWAEKLSMKLKWKTFDMNWSHGEKLLKDFEKRIPNVLRDMGVKGKDRNIKEFLKWIEKHIIPLNHKAPFSGALGLYTFTQ